MTSLDWSEEDIWHFYNYRATAENYIKELKRGFFISHISTDSFYGNYADLMVKLIAYNAFICFKRRVLCGSWVKYTVETIRRLLFLIPAVIIFHARQWIIRLADGYRSQEFWLRARVRCPLIDTS